MTIRNKVYVFKGVIFMNKKMIMMISALVCANIVAFAAQRGNIQTSIETKVDAIAEPLTVEQNKIYQDLVAKFKAEKLSSQDNTVENIAILNQHKAFLQSEVLAHKQASWKSWLASITGSLLGVVGSLGSILESRHLARLNEPHYKWQAVRTCLYNARVNLDNARKYNWEHQDYWYKQYEEARDRFTATSMPLDRSPYTERYTALTTLLMGIGLLSVPVVVYKFYSSYTDEGLKEKEIVMIDVIIKQFETMSQ